jgi:ABC-2 type transport system permease protein
MRGFTHLFLATFREWRRDQTALLWTVVFPVIIALASGLIFGGDDATRFEVGVVNEASAAGARLVEGLRASGGLDVFEGARETELDALDEGKRRAVIIIPAEFEPALAAYGSGTDPAPVPLVVYHDPAYANAPLLLGAIQAAVAAAGVTLTGVTPLVMLDPRSVSLDSVRYIDYVMPGVLAMSLMQLGLFATGPVMVSLRERGVLRRMSATPVARSALLAAQVSFRVLIALFQVAVITVISAVVYDVPIHYGNLPGIIGVTVLGAGVFITLSYFLAALTRTEEAVNGLSGLPNVVFMLLAGIFFPVDTFPGWLRPVVDAIPLTYLGDALRQLMVGARPDYSLTTDVGVLVAWLVVCALLAVRFFRWEPQA